MRDNKRDDDELKLQRARAKFKSCTEDGSPGSKRRLEVAPEDL
jgi:hypothetical protein